MNIEIVPFVPKGYWKIDRVFDGIYSNSRFCRHRDEFVTRFPIIMKVKVDKPLMMHLGEEEYVSYIIENLNEPPPKPKYSGRGRRPKQRPPVWGNLELIWYKFRNKEKDVIELTMYTDKKKNKKLCNLGAGSLGSMRPDGRKNRKKKDEV